MGATKENMSAASRIDLYDKLIATHPEIERKGAANPYTSLNGNMFTLLQDSRRLAIRLPEDQRAEFVRKHKTRSSSVWRGHEGIWAVPDALLKNTKELEKYLELSYQYVKTLSPADQETKFKKKT